MVTSPPYWGLRDYGIEEQIGLEGTMPQFLHRLVAIFAEVRRVLTDDGTPLAEHWRRLHERQSRIIAPGQEEPGGRWTFAPTRPRA